jgi:hypothetical protein
MTLRQPTLGHGANARFDEEATVMVSKAIASLDAWLARAEEVLAEQREHAISPSLAPLWDHGQQQVIITMATLTAGLDGLLRTLCAKPGRWILIVERNDHRQLFWQALAFEDGSLITEVVSNTYLEPDDRWTPEQEEVLASLGWEPPGPRRPNWISVEATTSPDIGVVVDRAVATMTELFGLREADEVLVKMFSSPNRGHTPAGPEYEVGQEPVLSTEDENRSERHFAQRHYFTHLVGFQPHLSNGFTATFGLPSSPRSM